MPENKSRRYWLIVAVAISVLPFLLLAGYSTLQLVQGKQEDLTRQLIDRSQATANGVAEHLAVSAGALQALASSDAAARDDLPAVYAQALRIVRGLPDLSAIALMSADGQVLFSTMLPWGSQPFPAGDMDSIRTVFDTAKPVVTEPYTSHFDKQVTVTAVSVPVLQRGKVVYCLRAFFRSTSLNHVLAAQRLPVDWVAGILSGTGLVVARSRAPEQFVGKPSAPSILEALVQRRQGVFDATLRDGSLAKTVIVPVPGWDWHVVMGVPFSTFQQPLSHAFRWLGAFATAVLALGAIAVGWLAYWVRRPKAMRRMDRATALSTVGRIWPSALALGIALLIGGLSTHASQEALHGIRDLTDRRQAINRERRQIVGLLAAYTDVETGQRGFVITGNDKFLEPYRAALAQIPLLTNTLKAEMERTGIGYAGWVDLAYYSATGLSTAAQGIALRRQLGPKAIQDGALFERGKLVMDKVRFLLTSLELQLEAEAERINSDVVLQEQKTRQLQWLAQFAVTTLVLLSISSWLYERHQRQRALKQLQLLNATLESRVTARTHDLARASQRIKDLAQETERIVVNERKRLSREVHDQLGQLFTGLKLIVRTLRPGCLPLAQHQAMLDAIESGTTITRRIAAELRPPLLDDFGLPEALEHYLKSTLEPLGIAFDLRFPDKPRLSPPQMQQLFRMVQEGCTNIIRHAQARHVAVTGQWVHDGLEVCVEDDGIGFDKALVRADALGLAGIEERATLSGAVFSLTSQPGSGTRLAIRFPYDTLLAEDSP